MKINLSVCNKILLTFLLLGTTIGKINAQDQAYPQNYFINPLDLPISLAGTFGEIRSNHFHTGLDIRTDGREGLVVHAAADGYISRINVSPYGYGNSIFVTHPNGFVTVYGHLSRYTDAVTKYVRKHQYEKHEGSVDLFLRPDEMPVKKGDTIAFSGSTGAAEGPHLHFEIRNEKSEDPLNPFLFGFKCVDHVAPIIVGICIYPLNDSSNVNGKHESLYIKAEKKDKEYVLATDSSIMAYGKIGIGIRTYDMTEGLECKNGPYNQVLTNDKDTIFFSQMDELSFSTGHYVNGHIDYPAFVKSIETIEHSFEQDNDQLMIYKKLHHKGKISCTGGVVHHMQYNISDFNGNTSVLPFTIHSEDHIGSVLHDNGKYISTLYWRKPFDCAYKGLSIHVPADISFADLKFRCTDDTTALHTLCPIYHVMNKFIPLCGSYTLKLQPAADLPDTLKRRALIVSVDGKHINAYGGTWEDGYLVAHPRSFGDFTIMYDLTRPVIKELNIYPNKDMSKTDAIRVKITDDLSGIDTYTGYIDGKWILLDYDYKKDIVYYTFDEHCGPGKHHFKLVTVDNAGNANNYEVDFTR